MKYSIKQIIGLAIMASVLFVGCGGSGNSDQASDQSSQNNESGLTAFEQENGIGPVTEELDLAEIDEELAKKGQNMFETKCSACHKMDERYVGPQLREITEERTPEYVMNMILNPAEMVKKHPEAKKKLAEFMTPMPNQNLSREEARSIVEFLRYMNENKDTNEI
ncbi:c-type cytochrome [Fodinibius saliphilus]|uniref:c-type cytochrome n=1 Tax=Fodinibius saliphilus TaxID=1920650 RepID=UPI0011092D88|nr:cytochrome c [Fodinibius saliphilus]